MKLKRNDQCYCGSGKKYKKCCMDKSISKFTVPIEDSESAFEHIIDKSIELAQILKRYNVEDITRAIFCINSWPRNRSALAQTLALNQALLQVESFGAERIKSYLELNDFYQHISKYLKVTVYEDLTLCDFGEVKININDIYYPIILGTGHEQVFGVMHYIEQLAKLLDRETELIRLLEYNKLIILNLSGEGLNNSFDENEIVFELPNEQFWNRVKTLFNLEQFKELKGCAYNIMGHNFGPIEMRHFFKYDESILPLFNLSLLIDFYKELLAAIVDKEVYMQHINLTIWSMLENTFNKGSKNPLRVLIGPRIFDIKNNRFISNNRFCFAVKIKNTVLLAVNEGDFKNEEDVKNEINLFNDLLKSGELNLLETYYRKEIQGGYVLNITSDMDVKIIHIKPLTDVTSHHSLLLGEEDGFVCIALDVVYFLYSMEDFSELVEFIDYSNQQSARLFIMGGKSSLYYQWKESNRQISSGAIEYSSIFIGYGSADDNIYNYFVDNLVPYPFDVESTLFEYPYEWNVRKNEFGYSSLEHKGLLGFGGEMQKYANSTYLFLAHNIEFFKPDDWNVNTQTNIITIEELNQRLFNLYGEIIFKDVFFENKIVQIMYMPNYYAEQVDRNGFTKDPNVKYVYSDIKVMKSSIIIRYTVNVEELMQDLMEASNRSVECSYFWELIKPIERFLDKYIEVIHEAIFRNIDLPKQVGVFSMKLDYYVSDQLINYKMDSVNFAKVRKTIAQVCFEKGIQPGVYKGKEATRVIREMQQTLVEIFENQIKDFSQEELHLQILSYYSDQLHQSIVNLKRYSSFKDIDINILRDFETRTRKERETNRRNIRMAQYLIETNLAITHSDKRLTCNIKEFETLLAFADWLVVLQDNADNCYYTELDVEIQIDSEYKVDTIFSQYSSEKYDELYKRKYNQKDYTHKSDEQDMQYLSDCIQAFEADTNVKFDIFISLLDYLQLEVAFKDFVSEVAPSVFEIKKDALYEDFISLLINPCEVIEVEKVLDFITIDKNKLKSFNGEEFPILPFWQREKRDNRFDVKPVLSFEDVIIVPTVLLNQLSMYWKNGIMDWYLPYEVGLGNLKKVIKKWKKRYEDEMVHDISNLLRDKQFDVVIPDFELYKRYPRSDYPPELGDYDIFGISITNKEIWIIESKVLQKVGSIYEDQMQQKSFFFQHKDDEKFQRRIDYMMSNYKKVLGNLGVAVEEYTVIPYMVTNKLFVSRYKSVEYPIVSYDEFSRVIKFNK
ncbi:SEC-C domain-containing protein [Lysinibacillus fusiformis]|uniref:SEC-C domain-containing protein n=1 Tax=Lysinibacillus fusiformis TaxID=28031 RepID=UPI0037FB2375